jgi:hypothetical protein
MTFCPSMLFITVSSTAFGGGGNKLTVELVAFLLAVLMTLVVIIL